MARALTRVQDPTTTDDRHRVSRHADARARPPEHSRPPGGRPRWLLLAVPAAVAVVVAGWAVWLGTDMAHANRELSAAAGLVATVQQQVMDGKPGSADERLGEVRGHAEAAHDATQGPHWSAARALPWVGNDVAVVQTGAEIIDSLAADVLPDLAEVAATVEPAALVPQDGRVDLQPLIDAEQVLVGAAHRVDAARAELAGLPERVAVSTVADARVDLAAELDELATMMATISRVVQLLPPMLGADGERTYLVLLQDPAEPRATGGVPVPVLLRADDGVVEVVLQDPPDTGSAEPEPPPSSSSDGEISWDDVPLDQIPWEDLPLEELGLGNVPLDQIPLDQIPLDQIPLDQIPLGDLPSTEPQEVPLFDGALPMVDPQLASRLADVTSTPDFPSAGEHAHAIWEEQTGESVDGVLSIEPGALALILGVTGPVTVADGTELTAENAAATLMNTIYLQEPHKAEGNLFLLAATKAVFDAVVGADWEPQAMVDALAQATEEDRLYVWSAREAEQELLTGTVLSGELRGHVGDSPVIGLFVNDGTRSKIGYYLGMDVTATTTECFDDGSQQVTVRVGLTSTAPPDAPDLPELISGGQDLPAGQIGADLLLYAPTGGTVESVEMTGLEPGVQSQFDGALSVVGKRFALGPGQEAAIEYVVHTGPDQPGTPIVRTTPLASVTTDVGGPACG